MTNEEIDAIVLIDGVKLCVNAGTEYAFPAFVEPGRLDQARRNAAALAGYDDIDDAVRGIPRQYRDPGEDRPDADANPVTAMRRLLRDGPIRGRAYSDDDLEAAWLPKLLGRAQWIIMERRWRPQTGYAIGFGSALRLAVRALYARESTEAKTVLDEIDRGVHDEVLP